MFEVYQTFLMGLVYITVFLLLAGVACGLCYLAYIFPYVGIPIGGLGIVYCAGLSLKKELERN